MHEWSPISFVIVYCIFCIFSAYGLLDIASKMVLPSKAIKLYFQDTEKGCIFEPKSVALILVALGLVLQMTKSTVTKQ